MLVEENSKVKGNNNIVIGNGNNINKSNIGNISNKPSDKSSFWKNAIVSALMSLVIGTILMFSFSKDFVAFIESLFN